MSMTTVLPELTFEMARTLGEFPEFSYAVTPEHIEEYCRITGDANKLYEEVIPPGFAAIFGRLGYLRAHSMPPGGVLLRQEIRWVKPARRGTDMKMKAVVISAEQ